MANLATVYARIDPTLKKDVDEILKENGLTHSTLIQLLYQQIKATKKIPIKLEVQDKKPIFTDDLNIDSLQNELKKGIESAKKERLFTSKEVEEIIMKELNK